jgi:uncharacterized membrane protein YphA (DoxX/SURF4 family)
MYGLLFLASALAHVTQTGELAAYAEGRGVPFARVATTLGGAVLILGALSVMLGVYADVGALVLAVFLLATAFGVHRFWTEPEGEPRQAVQTQFMKDLALAGASLAMFGLFAELGDSLGLTITGPLF